MVRRGRAPSSAVHQRYLEDLGLSPSEYDERVEAQEIESALLDRVVRDPSVPPAHKHDAIARHRMLFGPALFSCSRCFLRKRHCVCEMVERDQACRHRVCVWMHHKEFGRESNTGSLLALSLEGCQILVKGLREHDVQFESMLGDPSRQKVVLWPSPDALSAREALRAIDGGEGIKGEGVGAAGRGVDSSGGACLDIIVVDATWGGARRMMASLPGDIPRVMIDPGGMRGTSLLAPVRAYQGGHDTRVCTLEAVAALLSELGEPVAPRLLRNLQIKVDAHLEQKNLFPVYGTRPPLPNILPPSEALEGYKKGNLAYQARARELLGGARDSLRDRQQAGEPRCSLVRPQVSGMAPHGCGTWWRQRRQQPAAGHVGTMRLRGQHANLAVMLWRRGALLLA